MSWKDQIPEIKERLQDYKMKRSKAKSAYNKYRRVLKRFYFLDAIIKPKQTTDRKEDEDLEIAVKDLFNSIGIKSIIPPNKDDFDVKSRYKNLKLGIEVKNGNMPSENDMFQAYKYKVRTGNDCRILVVYNNAKTNQEFDLNRITDALKNQYGIVTTKELYKGYLKLKKGDLQFQAFLEQITLYGLIKFSKKALGKPKNSDVAR